MIEVEFGAALLAATPAKKKGGGVVSASERAATARTGLAPSAARPKGLATTITTFVPRGPSDSIPRKTVPGTIRATIRDPRADTLRRFGSRVPGRIASKHGTASITGTAQAGPASIIETALPPPVTGQPQMATQALFTPAPQQASGQPWVDIGTPEITPHEEASFFARNKKALAISGAVAGVLVVGYAVFGRKAKSR